MPPTAHMGTKPRRYNHTAATKCPDCGHHLQLRSDLDSNPQHTRLRIRAKCNCGFSYQNAWDNCEAWDENAIVRNLIALSRAMQTKPLPRDVALYEALIHETNAMAAAAPPSTAPQSPELSAPSKSAAPRTAEE
jgi:hypothetical protein